MFYYHGSLTAGIKVLAPPPGKVLYLTNLRAYALFYIRDLEVNHVTCGDVPAYAGLAAVFCRRRSSQS